ncbi:hypothetical protein V2G26_000158 [Clonostachys chloroleuca]
MPVTDFKTPEKYQYLNGFNSFHESEAVKGALPIGANSPQKAPYGLYAEKLSGTAFTAPRSENQQSWLYRILPSAAHSAFQPVAPTAPELNAPLEQIPNQLRWNPFDIDEEVDWVRGLKKVSGNGDPSMKAGLGIYIFTVGRSMHANTAIYSSDGEMLVVAQHGVLDIKTELGNLLVRPNEIAVLPRGIRYRVDLPEGPARGYILELYQGHFILPELGPIGSNCLANPRDFQIPVADYTQDTETEWTIVTKYNERLFEAKQKHTPFDVVAWHGNLSIQVRSRSPWNCNRRLRNLPPRWLVQEDTFRPPWYHRNTMSEFMGLICGQYDAKAGGGFQPAGASLHNVMSAHGPDADTFEKASNAKLSPQKVGEGSMAFMFESCLMLGVTEWGLKTCEKVQDGYNEHSWTGLKPHFKLPE